jgi:hypothetical protein
MIRSCRIRDAIALGVLGYLAVSGCTSGSSGTAVSSSATLADELAQAYCVRQAACCAAGATTADAGAGGAACATDADSGADGGGPCVVRATLAASQQLAVVATAYAEGLVTINSATVPACVAAYQAGAACGAPLDVDQAVADPACAGLFTGYIPAGERCDTSIECLAGSYCLAQATAAQGAGQPITSVSGGGTLGVCFPYQQAGGPCNTTADCMPPLTCSPATLLCQ